MTHRDRRLVLEFGLGIAVCVAIALLDRPLIGLVGAGLWAVIFAVRAVFAESVRTPWVSESKGSPAGALAEPEHIVHANAPNCYKPGSPIYYPPEGHD